MRIFNGVILTDESVLRTREWFADNCLGCISEAKSGLVYVNDLEEYIVWQLDSRDRVLAGKDDHTFTFLQRAYFIQTGESVPMLKYDY